MGRKKRNAVHNYFSYDKLTNFSTCLVPGCSCKIKGCHSTNLNHHLGSKHPKQHMLVKKQNIHTAKEKMTKNLLDSSKSVNSDPGSPFNENQDMSECGSPQSDDFNTSNDQPSKNLLEEALNLDDANRFSSQCKERKRSAVHRYFSYDKATNKSSCLVPGCSDKMNGAHASNLGRHLYYKHPDEHIMLQSNIAEQRSLDTSLNVIDPSYSNLGSPVYVKQNMSDCESPVPEDFASNEQPNNINVLFVDAEIDSNRDPESEPDTYGLNNLDDTNYDRHIKKIVTSKRLKTKKTRQKVYREISCQTKTFIEETAKTAEYFSNIVFEKMRKMNADDQLEVMREILEIFGKKSNKSTSSSSPIMD